MMKKDNNLIIDGNAFYEVDAECMNRGLNQRKKEEERKEKNKNIERKYGKFK